MLALGLWAAHSRRMQAQVLTLAALAASAAGMAVGRKWTNAGQAGIMRWSGAGIAAVGGLMLVAAL